MKMFICSLAARLPGGGGWPGAYLPVSTPCASGEKARLPMEWRAQAAKTAASGLRQSMEYCGWLEEKGIRLFCVGDCGGGIDLLGGPLAEADGADFAGVDGAVEGGEGFFERRFLVVAVALVEVDDVDAEALERAVELFFDLRGGEAVIGFVADGEVEFGGDQVAVAGMTAEGFAEDALGFARAVLVGGVEEGDAVVEGGVNAADGLVAGDAAGDGEPGAETQFGDLKWTIAEAAILHWIPCKLLALLAFRS